jgi:hypothetical protein
MATDPDTLTDPALLRRLLANAERAGMSELVLKCQVRIAELAGQQYDDVLDREFWAAVTAAEEISSRKNRKTTRLSRTRQKVKRVGVVQCLIDWALDPKVTQGFKILVEGNHAELTGEAIVARHADKFPPAAVEAAKSKLAQYGVSIPTTPSSTPS